MIYDYHTHTMFSEDSEAPVDSMIERAIDIGIAELAITDHYDPDYPDPNFEFVPDFPEYHAMLDEKQQQFADRIKIVKGIEIGIQDGDTIENDNYPASELNGHYNNEYYYIRCKQPNKFGTGTSEKEVNIPPGALSGFRKVKDVLDIPRKYWKKPQTTRL